MTYSMRTTLLFAFVAMLFILEGTVSNSVFSGSWNSSLSILNMALISAIMALGVNLQWGFAGLFNVGVMGFIALGGLATVLVAMPRTEGAWSAGGFQIIFALLMGVATIALCFVLAKRLKGNRWRNWIVTAVGISGFFLYRAVFDPAVGAVESINPAATGYLGGLNPGSAETYRNFGWLTLVAWPVGGLLAAGAAWMIGKTALGLRSDYLAIATLGIAEIIIAIMKNEDWLDRGVKNVSGIPRPVPYEVDLQQSASFAERAAGWGVDTNTAASIAVKLSYSLLFSAVLITIFVLAQLALKSPWGRMMRAIRDNETAAKAMGKNVTKRHLQIFVLGSAICGIAGAMMTTLDGQLTPGTYQPLRFTFLIWVMVIVGGSGNNLGAVLGGFLIWWLWIAVEPMGRAFAELITSGMADDNAFRLWVLDRVAYTRLLTMGIILLLVLRFSPRGLVPER